MLVAAFVWWWRLPAQGGTRSRREESPPATRGRLRQVRLQSISNAISPAHARRIDTCLRSFWDAYSEAAGADRARAQRLLRAMFLNRARIRAAFGELGMRAPNDPASEKELVAAWEQLDAAMLARIDVVRRASGTPLLHPGPVDNAWYGAWYRASNDASGGVL